MMPPAMDGAKTRSASWLFLPAKNQAGRSIGTRAVVILDSILVCNHDAGIKAKSKKYPDDISDHYLPCFLWFLRLPSV